MLLNAGCAEAMFVVGKIAFNPQEVLGRGSEGTSVYRSVLVTLPVGAVAKYCNERICVCLSVSLQAYLPNHTRDLYRFFCARCRSPWLGPLPMG